MSPRRVKCPTHRIHLTLRDTRWGPRLECPHSGCTIALSVHRTTLEPMGVPADRPTRQARMRAHRVFDQLWKLIPSDHPVWKERDTPRRRKKMRQIQRSARTLAYKWLRHELGMTPDECHIGRFNRATCERVIDLVNTRRAEEVA